MLTPEQLEARPQDMRLRMNTPQLNRLRYLVGVDLSRYVRAGDVSDYDGKHEYLVTSVPVPAHELPLAIEDPRIMRAASQDEFDEVRDLRDQLDNLWSSLPDRKKYFSQSLSPTPYTYGSITESE